MLMAEQWDQFARAVLPQGCSPLQRQEMRRAFYAGGTGVLSCVIGCLEPGSEPTDGDLRMMDGLVAELQDFTVLMKEGRA